MYPLILLVRCIKIVQQSAGTNRLKCYNRRFKEVLQPIRQNWYNQGYKDDPTPSLGHTMKT